MKKLILLFSIVSMVSAQTWALPDQGATHKTVQKLLMAKAELAQTQTPEEAQSLIESLRGELANIEVDRKAVIQQLADLGEISQSQANDLIEQPSEQQIDVSQLLATAQGSGWSTGPFFLWVMTLNAAVWVLLISAVL